ncbi:hypothetical protein GYB14_16690 [bacterium]|nr:hypothetical protein [bacterium]
MLIGNINRIPYALPYASQAAEYDVPAGEQRLSDYPDLEIWMQPDQGNVIAPSPNLAIASRFGGYAFTAKGAGTFVTTDLTEAVEVVQFPVGAPTGSEPLRAEGYNLGGDYVLCGLFRFDDAADMSSTVHTLFSAGIDGTASKVQVYALGGSLIVRHNATDCARTGVFSAGEEYLVMITFDAATGDCKAYVNSTVELGWSSENALAAAGGDDALAIGGRWIAGKAKGAQIMDGVCRAAWAGRAPWGMSRYDTVRTSFLTEVAGLYSDITLA